MSPWRTRDTRDSLALVRVSRRNGRLGAIPERQSPCRGNAVNLVKETFVTESTEAIRSVTVRDREGLHARPVMRFVDLAQRFKARVTVRNASLKGEPVDGKSAMQMMLLEATQGSVLEIHTRGVDAESAAQALSDLVEKGFQLS